MGDLDEVRVVVKVKNLATLPTAQYLTGELDYARLKEVYGFDFLGFYHSHPKPNSSHFASRADQRHFLRGYLYLIYGMSTDAFSFHLYADNLFQIQEFYEKSLDTTT